MIDANNLPEKLTQFLHKHNALDAFRRNISLYSEEDEEPRRPINQLNEAFNWSTTPQGFNFWRELHGKWVRYLEV